MRHLFIGQRQKAPNFSAFHWSPHGCLITIGQHFVTTRVVHLPKRTETSLITKSDQSGPNHQLLQLCTAHTAWSDSDQAVRAVHSCISWFLHCFWSHITNLISTFVSPVTSRSSTSGVGTGFSIGRDIGFGGVGISKMFTILGETVLCDRQGALRRAILYADSSCSNHYPDVTELLLKRIKTIYLSFAVNHWE